MRTRSEVWKTFERAKACNTMAKWRRFRNTSTYTTSSYWLGVVNDFKSADGRAKGEWSERAKEISEWIESTLKPREEDLGPQVQQGDHSSGSGSRKKSKFKTQERKLF